MSIKVVGEAAQSSNPGSQLEEATFQDSLLPLAFEILSSDIIPVFFAVILSAIGPRG